ncbi:MAG: SDR family oxidoreductase, partial [Desulfatitalea sp.]|nr:SDR family oxidoreductase [Desulfatitalea sp.]NNK01615.1 SDR family oxidoreductase [Desulfatitalea sp.]
MALMFSIPDPEPMDGILSLKGQCAVVTGGSRGLGEAIVKRFVEAGATVVLTGRGLEALQRVEAQVAEAGGTALGVQADVSRIEDSEKVINKALERFGKIDILVNNAAVYQGCMSLEMTEAFWDETVDTDLKGAFFAAQFAAKAMVEAGSGGRIINLLSVDAFKISGFLPAYTAAKAGLWAITQSLAKELAQYRILVNAVCPGAILTTERIAAMSTGKMVDQQIAPFAVKTREMMMGKFKAALESGGLANRMTNMMPLGR